MVVKEFVVSRTDVANGTAQNGAQVSTQGGTIVMQNGTQVSTQQGTQVVIVHVSISPILYLDIAISLGNIVLLILLLYIYWDNYKKIKSVFTLGLMIFAGLLLLQNIVFSGFLLFGPIFRIAELGLPLFILNITEFLALLTLLVITWKS